MATRKGRSLRFGVSLDGQVHPRDAQLIEKHLDEVMNELVSLGADDATVDADLQDGTVVLAVTVAAANPVEAVHNASGLIRTAIHAAGGATPDWPGPHDEAWSIRLIGVRSTELVDA